MRTESRVELVDEGLPEGVGGRRAERRGGGRAPGGTARRAGRTRSGTWCGDGWRKRAGRRAVRRRLAATGHRGLRDRLRAPAQVRAAMARLALTPSERIGWTVMDISSSAVSTKAAALARPTSRQRSLPSRSDGEHGTPHRPASSSSEPSQDAPWLRPVQNKTAAVVEAFASGRHRTRRHEPNRRTRRVRAPAHQRLSASAASDARRPVRHGWSTSSCSASSAASIAPCPWRHCSTRLGPPRSRLPQPLSPRD